jgi:hypothetical protein
MLHQRLDNNSPLHGDVFSMAVSPAIEKNKSSLRSLRLCGEKSSLVFDLLLLAAIEAFMMVFSFPTKVSRIPYIQYAPPTLGQ